MHQNRHPVISHSTGKLHAFGAIVTMLGKERVHLDTHKLRQDVSTAQIMLQFLE